MPPAVASRSLAVVDAVSVAALGLALALGAAACPLAGTGSGGGEGEGEGEGEGRDAGPEVPPYPPPATDVTAAVGSAATLELVTFNVKNFPCGNDARSTVCRRSAADTPALLADIIASLDVDLVALQEVASTAAFDELVARLPEHEGLVSPHQYSDGTYQKIGFLYRSSVLTAGPSAMLFRSNLDFPRPALQVPFTWTGEGGPVELLAVSVHLKAGEATEDVERRQAAITQMEAYARNLVDGAGAKNIIFLGDFNEDLRDAGGLARFAPFRDTARYSIRTKPLADAREVSYLPLGVLIDHVVTTSGFNAAFGNAPAQIPRVDADVASYRQLLSDHLPVVLVVTP